MEIEKKKPRSLAADLKDAVDLVGDGVGTAASPSVLLLIVLFNSTGKGRGFNGYVTNPPQTAMKAGSIGVPQQQSGQGGVG
jgi:hypothetical protein